MPNLNQTLAQEPAKKPELEPPRFRGLPPKFLTALVVLCIGFSFPLYSLIRFALQSDLYSYVLLVPAVCVYLFLTDTKDVTPAGAPRRGWGILLAIVGFALLGGYGVAVTSGDALPTQDALALSTLSFVALVAAICAVFLPRTLGRVALFPLCFLVFLAPFPVAVEHAIESFLQYGSAPPSYWLFKLAGTPVFRQDMIFELPGMRLQIAPECSGIRSTLVLFMTSLVAAHLFLRSPSKKLILVAVVVPLALMRNGFRIFTIGELCVHVGPHMIDSQIHHRGGPIFFALSLIPFSVLVYYLVKSDRRKAAALRSAN